MTYLLLKRGGLLILQQLSRIFQFCLDNGVTPDLWKVAFVTPISKRGDRTVPDNYRPVSLTSCVAKLMESCVKEEIWNFWCTHDIIRSSQFGFVRGSSCSDQLLLFLEDITKILDRGSCVDVIYLDFAKAFNSVPLKRLMLKLSSMGIQGDILSWIKSFLLDGSEQVCVSGRRSVPYCMASGVPQGSILGPLVFIAFVNDIDENLNNSTILKYADDIKLYQEITHTNSQQCQANLQ